MNSTTIYIKKKKIQHSLFWEHFYETADESFQKMDIEVLKYF